MRSAVKKINDEMLVLLFSFGCIIAHSIVIVIAAGFILSWEKSVVVLFRNLANNTVKLLGVELVDDGGHELHYAEHDKDAKQHTLGKAKDRIASAQAAAAAAPVVAAAAHAARPHARSDPCLHWEPAFGRQKVNVTVLFPHHRD